MTSTVIFFLAYPLAFIYQAFFYRTKPVLQVSQSQSRQIHQTDFALMNLIKICQNHQFCDILL